MLVTVKSNQISLTTVLLAISKIVPFTIFGYIYDPGVLFVGDDVHPEHRQMNSNTHDR